MPRGRFLTEIRKFDGKNYFYYWSYKLKSKAKETAKRLRKQGYLVRIERRPDGKYALWRKSK